ncbi:MAG: thioredoxin [Syntrophobacterales bacterium CG_4_9_14_3_um_filter_49_8]|nr:MAG: thioredoxin [Syntrophobacterales bacterium CG23_combo_of_CG06-09_8_20_14_all_48_27]PJA50277.1 MAG: thioredoxin [Syntrophobacterales bacterium CG_4_9_14_3_um_filter_49_8]
MDKESPLIYLNENNFDEEILKSEKPALVDFWAPWCGPCKMIGPIIEGLAEEYRGRVKVTKLNVDDNPNKAAAYGIKSIPTLILFKDGKVLDTLVGMVSKDRLIEFVNKGL